jgi:hypothetical protein
VNTPASDLGSKVQHLLDLVLQHRDEKCAAIRETAQAEAKALLHAARREARERLHNDIIETRRLVERTLASLEAQRQTRQRKQHQAEDGVLLITARAGLQTALLQRWQQPAARRRWCEELVNAAVTTLEGKAWAVEHPADWPLSEQDALRDRINSLCGKTPRLQANADISAGLRICAADTCLDATIDGLLHDRERIDGELLALCAERIGSAA